jgi:hypothetical protein
MKGKQIEKMIEEKRNKMEIHQKGTKDINKIERRRFFFLLKCRVPELFFPNYISGMQACKSITRSPPT